jgi:hypothetical protein
MTSFLSQILQELLKQPTNISHFTFVLPSKRAGAFLRKEISQLVEKPVFSPKVLSIEEFTENVSQLKSIDSVTTLFEFYAVYKECTPADQTEDFENFSNWAKTLIHDFNEIDRYLISSEAIFDYLSEIQDINHWSLHEKKTKLVENYLTFWKKLPEYYLALKENLLKNNLAYQGLIYRQASEKIEDFAKVNAPNYIFIGFNALNTAEQKIIQKMLEFNARVFWDIDEVHFQDKNHDASLFIREYAANWPYYKNHDFQNISNNYASQKEIEIIGIPKNIGQAKYVGEILANLSPQELNSTALVLGDETLLLPILNSMPENIRSLNITMGYPLKFSPFSSLFEKCFEMLTIENNRFYYKDVISVLSNAVIQKGTNFRSDEVIGIIKAENLLYLSKDRILDFFDKEQARLISLCFSDKKITPKEALHNFKELINRLKLVIKNNDQDPLNLEFLYQYHVIIENLTDLTNTYPHINSISSLHHFYNEISSDKSLDFQGKPFQGLQLMGMLESRVLDFETVILTSVNEGTLPAGKSNNSFIPYDLKKTFNLPTYKEKDAIYTYHFYHLLQRAKKIYLLHDSDTESRMGGEKSRFLIQLEVEKQALHSINNSVVIPEVPIIEKQLQRVHKTPEMLEILKKRAEKGFSPSALTTYMRNPIDFYRQYILGIRDKDEVEETVAYNTLGTVVHDTLEAFYAPLTGQELTLVHLQDFKNRTPGEVARQFEKTYSKAPISKGKNLLIFEVVKRYVTNFLKMEINAIESGKTIEIKEIESNLTASLNIEELDFPVNIGGKVDRVDLVDGILRIIDYKTGKVAQNQLEIVDWDVLTTDYNKYAKPFQVLMYATMLIQNKAIDTPVEAGVISFKNLAQGFLKFAKKDKPGAGAIKESNIDETILENFNEQLKNLILEICDPEIEFTEKEIKPAFGTF